MNRWFACGLVMLPLFCAAGRAGADEAGGAEKSKQIHLLVEQLGDLQFAVRERATEQLLKIGLEALPELEEASESIDREVRYRAQRILSLVRREEFKQRLESFLNDYREDAQYDLPGWKLYRESLGDDSAARALFVEMQKAERGLLEAFERSPKSAGETLANRAQELQQSMRLYGARLSLGAVSAMLFVAGEIEVNVPMQVHSYLSSYCHQPAFRDALNAGARKPLLRKILGNWIRRGEGWNAYQMLMLALQYDIHEGLIPAKNLLENKQNRGSIRQYALLTLAKFGDKSHIALVEDNLADNTRCMTRRVNNKTYEVQVRDVALVCAIELAGQDHKKFGFDQLQRTDPYVFNLATLGFQSDKERQASLDRWKEFKTNQNLPPAEGDSPEKETAAQKSGGLAPRNEVPQDAPGVAPPKEKQETPKK